MKQLGKVIVLVVGVIFVAACGSSSTSSDGGGGGGGGGTGTVSISTIDQLPKASDPVTGASGSISKNLTTAATTGIVLNTLSTSSFDQGDSQAACETAQRLRQMFTSATQGDRILCYIQNTFKNYANSGVDIYDGQDHYFNLNSSEDMGPDHVKLKITKTGDVITAFSVHECANSSQQGYTGQTISGTAFTMTSKGQHSGGGFAGKYYAYVTGVLNADGSYASKTIANAYTMGTSIASPTSWNEATLLQGVSDFTVSGYDKYSTDGSNFYTGISYSHGDLLGATPLTYAMGNGAGKYSYSWGNYSGGTSEGWLGDTAALSTNAVTDYLATDPTLPTASSTAPTSADFSGAEAYDCSGSVTLPTVDIDETTLATACDAVYGLQNYTWVNCYSDIADPLMGGFTANVTSGTCAANITTGTTITLAKSGTTYSASGLLNNEIIQFTSSDGSACTSPQEGTTPGVTTCATCAIDATNHTITFANCPGQPGLCNFTLTKVQ